MKKNRVHKARAILARMREESLPVRFWLTGTGARPGEPGHYQVAATRADGKQWLAGTGETPYQALARAGRDAGNAPRPSWAVISMEC